ncbi:hypothetical protein FRB91_000049 [Serendipita sp. 411]|nr:hypothetical protein FRC18_011168 [Serendipita sp. 400]KAG8861806.1 hypothetical protein FRB91_000049 [Serendipita sp. 411]
MFRQALLTARRAGAQRASFVERHIDVCNPKGTCRSGSFDPSNILGSKTQLFYPKRDFTSTATKQSGHNKWSKIRHNKAIQDGKKNVLYNKLQKDLLIAVQVGGSPDPALNATLAQAIKKAKSQGLPKSNLERTLARASGGGDTNGKEILYEIMTNDSVGLMASFVSDNPARAKQAMNEIVKDNGARFTPTSFLFDKKAVVCVEVPASEVDKHVETLWDVAIDLGAEDVVNLAEEGGSDAEAAGTTAEGAPDANEKVEIEILGPPNLLATLSSTLSKPPHSFHLTESELQWRPKDPDAARASAEALSEESKEALRTLVEELEESPECVGVWCSID